MTKNVYEKTATYFDIDDILFFKQVHQLALKNYEQNKDDLEILSTDELANYKKEHSPVIYASTVTKYNKMLDQFITRTEMNERARRKYLILDMDFNQGEEAEALTFKRLFMNYADKQELAYLIYPTISYPTKPRFRCVLFTQKAMTEKSYFQAITWLYGELGLPTLTYTELESLGITHVYDEQTMTIVKALDASNKKIKSNNNAPLYVNGEQIAFAVDKLDNPNKLDNKVWRDVPAPSFKKVKPKQATKLDADRRSERASCRERV